MNGRRRRLLAGALGAVLPLAGVACSDSDDDGAATMTIEEICDADADVGTVNSANSRQENEAVVSATAAYFADLSDAVTASDGPSDVGAAATEISERLAGIVEAPSNEELQIELTAFWSDPAAINQLEVLEGYITEVCPTARSLTL